MALTFLNLVGMIRINFQPCSREQLEKIVEARLASAKEEIDGDKKPNQMAIAPHAIKLAVMTISRITGDARRIVDLQHFFLIVPY